MAPLAPSALTSAPPCRRSRACNPRKTTSEGAATIAAEKEGHYGRLEHLWTKIDDVHGEMATGFRRKDQASHCSKSNATAAIMRTAEAADTAPPRAWEKARGPGTNSCVFYVGMAADPSRIVVASLCLSYERNGNGYRGINLKDHEAVGFMVKLGEVTGTYTPLHIFPVDSATWLPKLFVCAAGAMKPERARTEQRNTPRCNLALTPPVPRRQGRAWIPVAPADLGTALARLGAAQVASVGWRPRAPAGIYFVYWEEHADKDTTIFADSAEGHGMTYGDTGRSRWDHTVQNIHNSKPPWDEDRSPPRATAVSHMVRLLIDVGSRTAAEVAAPSPVIPTLKRAPRDVAQLSSYVQAVSTPPTSVETVLNTPSMRMTSAVNLWPSALVSAKGIRQLSSAAVVQNRRHLILGTQLCNGGKFMA